MEKVYDGKRPLKLGTPKHPAVVHVKTNKRLNEVRAIFEKNGWHFKAEIIKDQPEDINDLELLQNTPQTVVSETKVGRNAPCPCGSGKKYKKCCGP
jgi:SWIM/SEC-C metal-binding protein